MKNDRFTRLSNLRNELAQIEVPEYPDGLWSLIKSWIVKATPIIRRDWPEHIGDFQKATPEIGQVRVVSYITDRSGITFEMTEQESRRQLEMDNAEAKEVQQNALGFLDGLLTLSPDESLSSTFEKGGDNQTARITVIVAIIGVVGTIIVAIIELGQPLVSRLIDIYLPAITPTLVP